MINREDVIAAYQAFLDRAPESEAAIDGHRKAKSVSDLLHSFRQSPEFKNRFRSGPFWNFTSSVDAVEIINSHENHQRQRLDGHMVNYLGVNINVSRFFPSLGLAEIVEPPPIPANWHADIAEFAGALRAVDLASDKFTMIELGCGWGCWMNNTGIAATRAVKKPLVIGGERDAGHIEFAKESLQTNGFSATEYQLYHGIAAAKSGTAIFPRQSNPGESWGLTPIFDPPPEKKSELLATGNYYALDIIPLSKIVSDRRIDLLHVDIQGGEADLVRDCFDLLCEKVAYVLIGTHSRKIESDILQKMLSGPWAIEIERPAVCVIENGQLSLRVDGVQAYRNTLLRPL